MGVLQGDNLAKRFGGIVALNDVSFSVEEGETVGLIGPNGAGKSTLFKVISGELSPDDGSIHFNGQTITDKPPYEVAARGLVKTHQIVRPFQNLTIAENVEVGARFGRDDRDMDTVVAESLEFVGLNERSEDYPEELSIGALKRLEIARVLATKPLLLLLDEVAGGLDPQETEDMIDIIKEIREAGTTVFLIDHVMRALMTVSERVLVLNNGEVIARGTPEEIQNDETVKDAYLGKGSSENRGAPSLSAGE